jgi:hypothetical protein
MKMTMLIHATNRLTQLERSPDAHIRADTLDEARPASLKGIFAGAISVIAATAAAGGVIALKAVYFVSHFSH